MTTQVKQDLQHLELHVARAAVQAVQEVLQQALAAAQRLVGDLGNLFKQVAWTRDVIIRGPLQQNGELKRNEDRGERPSYTE